MRGEGRGDAPVRMDARRLWQAVLEELEGRLSKSVVDNYLRQSQLVGFDDDVATVGASNTFTASTLEKRWRGQVERGLSTVIGRSVRVSFVVLPPAEGGHPGGDAVDRETARLLSNGRPRLFADVVPDAGSEPSGGQGDPAADLRAGAGGGAGASAGAQAGGAAASTVTAASAAGLGAPVSRRPAAARANEPAPGERRVPPPRQIPLAAAPLHGLHPRYVYETYVVGSSNRFAHAASLAVADQPGGTYNPFFVHGGVGLGKTHLLHAVGHRALELRPDLRVSYVTSERFTNDLIGAIRQQRMDDFRGRYREADILMIDDIQFIAGKESTQEEFFHTFNELYQSGKQVIITSDKPPKAIASLEERLRSRFEGGLIADVQLPDFEMRTAILRTKGEELGIGLPGEVVEYIAHKDQSNIRELEGALNKVLARAQLANQPLTLTLAMEALTDVQFGNRRNAVTRAEVVSAVVRHYGVDLRDLLGRSRVKEIVLPRQVAMYLMREETGASLLEIGTELGGRDHTTVLHGIRQIERALGTDTGLRSEVMAIREAILSAA